MIDKLKIAIVCDWLTVYAGAERVVYEMHKLFPNAPIYTTLYNKNACPLFKSADIRESGLGLIPFARHFHRLFFPFMPGVFERMDLDDYDIVISSAHSVAKSVITKPETLHISYCHSPMRYVWDQSHSYQKGFFLLRVLGKVTRSFFHRVRMWDRVSSERVDKYIANSKYIARRIKKYYGRESFVIYPPVDLTSFSPGKVKRRYYLAVGRLIPYKRFDLIVKVFNDLGLPLKIVGVGPERRKLMRMAKKNIEFLGRIPDEDLKKVYQGAKALIFPQLEDFGIVPLEAMACGTPVIAYGKGGSLETVKRGLSGLFFDEQTPESLKKAVFDFEGRRWNHKKIASSVRDFSSVRFKSELRHFVKNAWKEHMDLLGNRAK